MPCRSIHSTKRLRAISRRLPPIPPHFFPSFSMVIEIHLPDSQLCGLNSIVHSYPISSKSLQTSDNDAVCQTFILSSIVIIKNLRTPHQLSQPTKRGYVVDASVSLYPKLNKRDKLRQLPYLNNHRFAKSHILLRAS